MTHPSLLIARIGTLLEGLAGHDAYADLRLAHARCVRFAQGTLHPLSAESLRQETIDLLGRVQGAEWPLSRAWYVACALEAHLAGQHRLCGAFLAALARRHPAGVPA